MESLPPLREVLAKYDLFAKKSFGQHFLLDLNLTDKIARLAGPHPAVVEVGPGPGGLTRSLLNSGVEKLHVIEMDQRFIPVLEDIAALSDGRLDITEADALKVDLARLDDHRPLRICANLPYNVGTKLVINWLMANPLYWDRMVLMLQKEVAERIAANPGEKAYGRLAILAGSIASSHIAFEVPARAFTPPPKVDSAIIVMNALPADQRFSDLATLGKITEAAFGQRRKMLRKSLRSLAENWNIDLNEWLDAAGIEPSMRPEVIDLKGFHALAQWAKVNSSVLQSTV
ncbi:MAG: 16S rRNA (adenine(1518)-N(6)/adenine(1519)-N(6))-dimethyltransferase RsmA [Acidimicrobiales bacterium]|nr:MAG: 16S rRNA (adenine(1518)-N(6)/adenine(1519)-N(6))-dimethyltransferase RsmA [Acidimicrobiales bacterium]